MMTKQKALIGTELDKSFHSIEASRITRLNHAFAVDSDVEPVQSFPPFLMGNLINLPMLYKTLGLNINHVLLSRESVIAHHALKIGDTVAVRTFLKDAYEQQASGNPIGFIILESIGFKKDVIAFYCERVLAIRGGFQRGRAA